MKTRIVYRDSITGRFVTKAFAEKHPDTTQRHVIKGNYILDSRNAIG